MYVGACKGKALAQAQKHIICVRTAPCGCEAPVATSGALKAMEPRPSRSSCSPASSSATSFSWRRREVPECHPVEIVVGTSTFDSVAVHTFSSYPPPRFSCLLQLLAGLTSAPPLPDQCFDGHVAGQRGHGSPQCGGCGSQAPPKRHDLRACPPLNGVPAWCHGLACPSRPRGRASEIHVDRPAAVGA